MVQSAGLHFMFSCINIGRIGKAPYKASNHGRARRSPAQGLGGSESGLVPLPDVVASELRIYGQCFGTDGKVVFYRAQKLPLSMEKLRTESYFIWDDEKVFITGTQLPLHGKTFRILGKKQLPNGLYFRLADEENTIVLGPGNNCLPDGPPF